MTELEILDFVESKLDTLYKNQEKNIESTDKIYNLLNEEFNEEKTEVEEVEVYSEGETTEDQTEDVDLNALLLEIKTLEEQQLETLQLVTTNQSEILLPCLENIQKINLISVAFLGVILGVLLSSILSKYLKH